MNLDEVEFMLNKVKRKDGNGVTRRRIVPGDGDHRHGTENGYVNLGCRCKDCTNAFRFAWKSRAMNPERKQ